MPTLFFSVGLAVVGKSGKGQAQTMEIVRKLVADTGWRPGRVELIAGALQYTRYNFLVRLVMRWIVSKEGGDTDTSRDYEYTDWAAVDRCAVEFVDGVVQQRTAGIHVSPRSSRAEARV
jgi:menaquinone-dependent protoporphyrinogen oxidase